MQRRVDAAARARRRCVARAATRSASAAARATASPSGDHRSPEGTSATVPLNERCSRWASAACDGREAYATASRSRRAAARARRSPASSICLCASRARGFEIGSARASASSIVPAPRLRVALVGASARGPHGRVALRFGLLKLDVLALEASRHSQCGCPRLTADRLLQYSTGMHSAHDLLTRWPALDDRPRACPPAGFAARLTPGPLTDAAQRIARRRGGARGGALWRRDPSAWSDDAGGAAKDRQPARVDELAVADGRLDRSAARRSPSGARADGFTDVVLLGHGRLEPRARSAARDRSAWRPDGRAFTCSTRPIRPRSARGDDAARADAVSSSSSKSGTTIEPNSLAAHFRQRLRTAGVARWADHFVAITDEGTELAGARAPSSSATSSSTRPTSAAAIPRCRSSALVPAALMGQDSRRSSAGVSRCSPPRSPAFGTALDATRRSASASRWAPAPARAATS